MRLIDADKLPVVTEWCVDEAGFGASFHVVHEEDINNAPTIDPESLRPQGEWIDLYGGEYANHRYACSVCGIDALYKFEVDALGHEKAVQALSESCPHCGAKMKGMENYA